MNPWIVLLILVGLIVAMINADSIINWIMKRKGD